MQEAKKRKNRGQVSQRRRFDLATLSANKIIPQANSSATKLQVLKPRQGFSCLVAVVCRIPILNLSPSSHHSHPSLSLLYIHLHSAFFSCTFPPFFSQQPITGLSGMAVASRGRSATELQVPTKWRDREASPDRTKVWTEPKLKPAQKRSVPVVYYLSRNGQLEHPHFMEVPLSSPEGLYLRGNARSKRNSRFLSFSLIAEKTRKFSIYIVLCMILHSVWLLRKWKKKKGKCEIELIDPRYAKQESAISSHYRFLRRSQT